MMSGQRHRRDLRLRRRAALALVAIAAAAAVAAAPLWAQSKIGIEANWLDPPVLRATVGERVTFVNRSGRTAHVEFIGDSGRHHVEQVPDQIWAVFHRPGRHAYVVHFPDGSAPDLHGAVEVVTDPREQRDPQGCVGVTVMGVCLER